MTDQMYNIIRDYGGFIVSIIVLIIFGLLLFTNNPGAEYFKDWVGIILTAYLVADRGIKIAQGKANGKYSKDDENGNL